MLRIENLGNRLQELSNPNFPEGFQSAIRTLFELYDLLGNRADIKNELLQELDRQRLQLIKYSGQPGVSEEQLTVLVKEISQAHASLSAVPIRLGPHVMEHEWLGVLRGRISVAGGTCQFDIPSFYAWQKRPTHVKAANISAWLAPLIPLLEAIDLALRLLREGTEPFHLFAEKGQYEFPLEGRQVLLVRIAIDLQPELVAETSANKHLVAVRFRELDKQLRLQSTEKNVKFALSLCNF
tara:strand:- start:55724 stop:56440 length:717 start_codon:yes stop_codon:yes gene_type:complete